MIFPNKNPLNILTSLVLILLLTTACGISTSTVERSTTKQKKTKNYAFQSGVASWYGPDFHGKFTANGERYDMESMSAAHRSLPFGTKVRVVNMKNGKSAIVRINDRGPFVKNRVIDLSKSAARAIDMIGPGTAPVNLYIVEKGGESDQKLATTPTYTIQLGAYENRSSAYQLSRKLDGARVEKREIKGSTIYRIHYGQFNDWEKAAKQLKKIKRKGYNGFVKQLDNETQT